MTRLSLCSNEFLSKYKWMKREMKLKQYQVDAFSDHVFGGNPAAVICLESWLDDAILQAIAEENNLSETAYFVPTATGFHLRWFTPVAEVDLCGHATLAAAYVLFDVLGYPQQVIRFSSRSGELLVEKKGDHLEMNFPASLPIACQFPEVLVEALGQQPLEVLRAEDYLVVFDSEETVRAIRPNQALLAKLDLRGVIITARGSDVDFVSRFFAPKFGIPEDPVTGSAHCQLAPYWANKLGKNTLNAKQVSKRGGVLKCHVTGERVCISGQAVLFMEANIFI